MSGASGLSEGADDRLPALLDSGLSLTAIADRLGVSSTTVLNRIRRLGLEGTVQMRRTAAIRAARAEGRSELDLECPVHGVTAFWVGRTAVRCRRCNADAVARRRRKVKRQLVEEAGGACGICGYDRSPVALQFHHVDPAAKRFGLSQAGITRSIEASRREVAKCVLLCSNCHAEVEAGVAELPVR